MRKIKTELIERLLSGDLRPLLEYVKTDPELRLEVRQKGEAFVYYRKGKALEIGSLKVDKKYGNVPSTSLAISDPALYFRKIKSSIDNWLASNPRPEFDSQQNIARYNQDRDDRYLIIDMEYAFDRSKVDRNEREKVAVFDLLGVEKHTNKIVLFEVKRGVGATKGNSGITSHINDFNLYLNGKHDSIYRNNLYRDVKNIVADKIKLGLINNFAIPNGINKYAPELVFIFHPDLEYEIEAFNAELNDRHSLILVSNDDFKLK